MHLRRIHVSMHVCMYVCMHTCMYVRMHTYMHAWAGVNVQEFIHSCIDARMCAYRPSDVHSHFFDLLHALQLFTVATPCQ